MLFPLLSLAGGSGHQFLCLNFSFVSGLVGECSASLPIYIGPCAVFCSLDGFMVKSRSAHQAGLVTPEKDKREASSKFKSKLKICGLVV